jgi:hypothetical protein
VRKIQTEIQALKGDIAERTDRVTAIEQGLENLKEEYDKHHQNKDQEIDRAVREIEEEYNRKF